MPGSILQDFLGFGIKPMDKGLLICDYHDWKKIRPALSPSFSSGKIKQVRHCF